MSEERVLSSRDPRAAASAAADAAAGGAGGVEAPSWMVEGWGSAIVVVLSEIVGREIIVMGLYCVMMGWIDVWCGSGGWMDGGGVKHAGEMLKLHGSSLE